MSPPRKQKRIQKRILSERPDPEPTEIEVAVAEGEVLAHTRDQVLEAKRLFVIELLPLGKVAKLVGIPREHIERWAMVYGWAKDRRQREERVYQAMGSKMHAIAETLGIRTDEVAADLEGCIEDYIRDTRDSGDPLPPGEVSKLTRSLKELYDLRRTIHQREGKVDRKILEVQPSGEFTETLKRALSAASGPTKWLPAADVQDAEFDAVD